MKIVYVSGPYRADTIAGMHRNIENARAVAEYLWKQGYAVICPHLNTAYMDGVAADDVILKGDLVILRVCDAIAFVEGWYNSEGSQDEWQEAQITKMENLGVIRPGENTPQEEKP